MYDVVVMGGGPAGMMAAYAAGVRGLRVALCEQNEKLGKKLFITGKGRCNVTNACDTREYFQHIVKNPKYLMSALHRFPNTELLALLESFGLHTKIERGGRVFPLSDKSSDVIKTLEKMLRTAGVRVLLHCKVMRLCKESEKFVVETEKKVLHSRACVIATGGISYPQTGSTGDGYKIAEGFGHSIVELAPALVPLDAQAICAGMQGLSLKNVGFSLYQCGKKIYYEQGELLFAHFGLSGPVVISASSYIDHTKKMDLYGLIDLKPALSSEKLDARTLREFEANNNKRLKNVMSELLPSKMIEPFLGEIGLDAEKQPSRITRGERKKLVEGLKAFRIGVFGTRPVEEAIITAGGVNVQELNPSTMESRLIENLYFAGEVCDVSAQTGGFNLQIAFSTGYLAGNSVLGSSG